MIASRVETWSRKIEKRYGGFLDVQVVFRQDFNRLRRKIRNFKLAERGGFERPEHRFVVQSDNPRQPQSSCDFR